MQDAFYGLAFSWAVDALQDDVGFDAAYREASACTIYALEDHRFYIREAKEGDLLTITTAVLNVTESKFHLHMTMVSGGQTISVAEVLEGHVAKRPKPHLLPMPDRNRKQLVDAQLSDGERQELKNFSRLIVA